jgi:hypothetical protein
VDAPRRDCPPVTASKSVVSGEYGEHIVFILERRAHFLSQVWCAPLKSKTWGDLKQLAPPSAYREIRRRNRDKLAPSALHPNAAFDYYEMTGVPDGDYPGFPAQEMFGWMPRDIQLDFGNVGVTRLNGDLLELDPKDTKAIVQRLKQAGIDVAGTSASSSRRTKGETLLTVPQFTQLRVRRNPSEDWRRSHRATPDTTAWRFVCGLPPSALDQRSGPVFRAFLLWDQKKSYRPANDRAASPTGG